MQQNVHTLAQALIPSKISQPESPAYAQERRKLNDLLYKARPYSLVLVHSPAGFGKTTLVSQWAGRHEGPVAWYGLDCSDNEMVRFGAYLISSIDTATARQCPKTLKMALSGGYQQLELLFTQLFAELATLQEPLLIVLDDYHLIESETIHTGMRFFLKHMPPAITLAITSRSVPPLGVAQLRVQGKLLEVTNELLAFDADEAQTFLQQRLAYAPSRDQIERLTHQIEGWASALQLITLSAPPQDHFEELIGQLNRGHSYILDYLAETALQQTDEATKQFLYRTSILERFNDQLVAKVADVTNGQAILEAIERQGLFLHPLDSHRSWYRYHHLFATFLRHQLQTHFPGEEERLHQLASDAWREMGYPNEAAYHAMQAHDKARIIDILLNEGQGFYCQGQFLILQRCLGALDQQDIANAPLLTLLHAWAALAQSQHDKVETWLRAAEAILPERYSQAEWSAIQGEFNAIRAKEALAQCQTDKAIELAQNALAQQPKYLLSSRTAALATLGEANFVKGHLTKAQQQMEEAEQLAYEQNTAQVVLWSLGHQSEICIAQGFLQKAYSLQDKALQYVEEHQIWPMPSLEFIYRIRGQVLWEWYRLDATEQCAFKGIDILKPLGELRFLQCYVLLGKVALARGQQTICTDYVRKIQKLLATEEYYHPDDIANAHVILLNYWDATRDQTAIQDWLTSAPDLQHPASNHFSQCNTRNRVRAHISLGQYDQALALLQEIHKDAARYQLVMDQNRNHIYFAQGYWLQGQREPALDHLAQALTLANTTGATGSFLRIGKELIVMLKALLAERKLGDREKQHAEHLIQLARKQQSFSPAIRITLDEALIDDILQHPETPELIRTSPLTRREWQVLSLIHAGLSNEQIAEHLNVAPTTIKTHIRSLYQKLNITQRAEAIALVQDLLGKIQGE